MSRAIIADTETTGVDEPEVIELAFSSAIDSPRELKYQCTVERYKPSKPIQFGAMATHHIIPADLEDKPPSPRQVIFPGAEFMVGHKVDFDWKALGKPQVKTICTLALARRTWPDLDSHSLGALIYFLMPHEKARELLKNAHSAETDIYLCSLVLKAVLDLYPGIETWEQVYQLSEVARVPVRFTFGKYGPKDGKPGLLIADVRRMDPGYIRWCLSSCDIVTDDPYYIKALTQ